MPIFQCTAVCGLTNQGQTNHLDIKREFSLDQLPASFATRLARGEDSQLNRRPLNEVVRPLADWIWQEGGFRFRHHRTHTQNEAQIFEYACCQNKIMEKTSKAESKRDVLRSERFEYQGRMTMYVYLESRILVVTMTHLHHKPYVNINLDAAVLEFIGAKYTET